MCDTGNWIKLNRGIRNNFVWDFDKPKYGLCWIDMLLLANYKDKKIMFDGKLETVKRGSFITSMVKLADRWHMDRGTVKRFLDILQDDGMITYTCNNRRTIINIVNYSNYQDFASSYATTDSATDSATDSTTESTTKPTTDSAQHKNIKESKEGKESKEDNKIYESIIQYLNEKAGTKYKHTTKKTQTCIRARLAEGFTLDDFKTVVDKKCADWIGTDWEKYLRPETLFGTKFEAYLNAKVATKQTANTDIFGGYDMTDLDEIF